MKLIIVSRYMKREDVEFTLIDDRIDVDLFVAAHFNFVTAWTSKRLPAVASSSRDFDSSIQLWRSNRLTSDICTQVEQCLIRSHGFRVVY